MRAPLARRRLGSGLGACGIGAAGTEAAGGDGSGGGGEVVVHDGYCADFRAQSATKT